MRVLITGGAGFIGSHLVDHHLARGDEVVVVDDFSTGRRSNLAHTSMDRLEVHEGRVEAPGVLDAAFRRVDLVYHLAAAVGVFEILRRPLDALRSNIDATEAVFEKAATEDVRTLFASTSEVYGKNDAGPLRETDDSVYGPTAVSRWLYAVSKSADEFLGLAYHRERGLPVTIARLFNTAGRRQSGAYGMVVPRFVEQALRGDPITVFGDGKQTRCFTNVGDVVEAFSRLAETPAAIGQVVNIGNPCETSMLELADLVRTTVPDCRSTISHVRYEDAYGLGYEDMRRRIPDVARLRALTGYAPATPLETTIREIVDEQLAWAAAGGPTSAEPR